jgi:hypothetical protein
MTGDGRPRSGMGEGTKLPLPSSRLRNPPGVLVVLTCVTAIAFLAWIPAGAATLSSSPGAAAGQIAQPSPTPDPDPADVTQTADDPLLLPDLMTTKPAGLEIRGSGANRVLRFNNVVWNHGEGPLELFGEPDHASGTIRVVQRAYTSSGVVVEWPVGVFTFHPTHLHWHLEGFVVYELWSLGPGGEPDQLIKSSGKLSYCLIDTDIVDGEDPLRPANRQYYGCGRAVQGLSIGWGDTYKAYLDGQSLPLDGVPDGLYALVSTANANRVLKEAKISNNAGTVVIQINGNRFTVIPAEDVARVSWLVQR